MSVRRFALVLAVFAAGYALGNVSPFPTWQETPKTVAAPRRTLAQELGLCGLVTAPTTNCPKGREETP